MSTCTHDALLYVRRTPPNQSAPHICLQCQHCLELVKLPRHNNRPYITLAEVPAGHIIGEWRTAK